MNSMTGMGRSSGARKKKGVPNFVVEVRSVNHRFCEVSVKLPSRFQALEYLIVQEVKKKITRGKIDVWLGEEKGEGQTFGLNEASLKAYYQLLKQASSLLKLKEEVGLAHLQQGSSFWMGRSETPEEIWPLVKKGLEEALKNLLAMRVQEGKALSLQISERLDFLDSIRQEIFKKRDECVQALKEKLSARIQKLLSDVEVDQNKLANEIVFFADRTDITEEMERLESHSAQIRLFLKKKEPCGRQLDFLIQEMNREWNTIASKSQSASISQQVVTAKSEMEKIREQIQNIE